MLSTRYSEIVNVDSLKPIDRKLYMAHFDKEIQYFETKSDIDKLSDLVSEWRISVGIREQPSEEEHLLNMNFIKENFGHFTIKHLKLAIQLSLTDKLKVKVDMFGINFAPLYIGKILNAYVNYVDERMKKLLQEQEDEFKKTRLLSSERGYEQKVTDKKIVIAKYIKEILHSDKYVIDFTDNCWKFLKRNNLVHTKNVDFTEAQKYAKRCVEMASIGLMGTILNAMNPISREKEQANMEKMYGRYYAMKEYFSKIENIDEWMAGFTDEQFVPKVIEQPKLEK